MLSSETNACHSINVLKSSKQSQIFRSLTSSEYNYSSRLHLVHRLDSHASPLRFPRLSPPPPRTSQRAHHHHFDLE